MIVGPDREFVALDLETTGLDCLTDRIIEVGALRFDASGQPLGSFDRLVNPLRASSPAAFRVHQISDESLIAAPTAEHILPDLLDFLGDPGRTTVIAHNAAVDAGFLGMELVRAGLAIPGHPVLDTLAWTRRRHPDWQPVRLSALAERLGGSDPIEHRALADCRRVWRLFDALRDGDPDAIGRPPLAYPIHDGREPLPAPIGWDDVTGAIHRGDSIRIAYSGGTQGAEPRAVTPLRFEFRAGRAYLVARCHRDAKDKDFQVDRIERRELVPAASVAPIPTGAAAAGAEAEGS